MKIREFHNIECLEININGAGVYHFPKPDFAGKKIDSIFLFPFTYSASYYDEILMNNTYIDLFSADRRPLYTNVPAVSFRFDNLNNRIDSILDFDLSQITYTGTSDFSLAIYFSTDEKLIDFEEFIKLPLNHKTLTKKNAMESELNMVWENDSKIFDDNDINYFRGKTVKQICIPGGFIVSAHALNIILKNGNSFKNLPCQIFFQNPVGEDYNINKLPFLMCDEIDFDRSYMGLIETRHTDITVRKARSADGYIDLTFSF